MDFKKELRERIFFNGEYTFDFELLSLAKEYIDVCRFPLLYRYSPADYYNIRMLEKKSIYLSPMGKLNDAFEGVNLDNIAFVKCFSEKKDDLEMWGLYADSYSGMCVEYDVNRLVGTKDEHLLYHLYPVIYSEQRVECKNLKWILEEYKRFVEEQNSQDGLQHAPDSLQDIMYLFLVKSNAWAREKEWRLLVTNLQMYTPLCDCEDDETKQLSQVDSQTVLFDCIKTIYLGPRMNDIKREHIREICERLGIAVVEVGLSDSKYEIVY